MKIFAMKKGEFSCENGVSLSATDNVIVKEKLAPGGSSFSTSTFSIFARHISQYLHQIIVTYISPPRKKKHTSENKYAVVSTPPSFRHKGDVHDATLHFFSTSLTVCFTHTHTHDARDEQSINLSLNYSIKPLSEQIST